VLRRKPTTGIASCCGRALSGTAAAPPPLDHLLLDEATPFGKVPRAAKRQPHRMDT
jgi:hypothetical protein